MPFCTCQDITLYYEVHGEGFPLLLVAGLSGGTWSWYGQVPYFQKHYKTIVFDNRGAGRSDMPPGPYNMKQLAKDALCLLDRLEVEEAFVMALSMGGMIAQELALLAPQRIRALVLGCTHSGGRDRVPPAPFAVEILLDHRGLTQEQILEKNLPIFFSEECLKNRPEVTLAYCTAQVTAPLQPEHAFQAQLAAISTFDCSERLSEIRIPTLVLTGTRDVLIPSANAFYLARHLPDAELVELPGAGHALHAECRDWLNILADHFFQRRGDNCASVKILKP